MELSIVLPARNEARNIGDVLDRLRSLYPGAEIIIVDDASDDGTDRLALEHGATRVISQPYSMGNGAAIKRGARAASHEMIVFMDADGQHRPDDIARLLELFEQGYDMVVGARHASSHAGNRRRWGNGLYNMLASAITGHRIDDLTSGFRVVRAKKFHEFIHLLPNGFSYPTTITMAFFRSGYSVGYVPVMAEKRKGKSHIRLTRDGPRFLLIIFRIGTLYSPLKLFFPISALLLLTGTGLWVYNFALTGRFTNMSAMLLLASILVFLIGLISEQITNLLYSSTK